MNNIKMLKITVVLLLLLNITTIGTILFNKYNTTNDKTIVLNAEGNNLLSCHFVKETIGFDKNQMQRYKTANLEFRPKANSLVLQIDTLKNSMFTELQKRHSDTLKLNAYALQTGALHAELKKETNRFYLIIKKIATPNQVQKLQTTFSPLFCKGSCGEKGMKCGTNACK